jgi:hypothetical protein
MIPSSRLAKRTAGINDPRVARVLDADVIDGVAIAVTEFVHGLDLDRFREWAHVSGVLATGSDESAEKWQKIVAYIGAEVAGGLARSTRFRRRWFTAASVPAQHHRHRAWWHQGARRGAATVCPIPTRAIAASAGLCGAELSSAEPNPKSDMRALGAMLFELATGELPPPGGRELGREKDPGRSLALHGGFRRRDFWPRIRPCGPSAAEAAKILSDFWSEIPDASMVAEVAVMVRNFSGSWRSQRHLPIPSHRRISSGIRRGTGGRGIVIGRDESAFSGP